MAGENPSTPLRISSGGGPNYRTNLADPEINLAHPEIDEIPNPPREDGDPNLDPNQEVLEANTNGQRRVNGDDPPPAPIRITGPATGFFLFLVVSVFSNFLLHGQSEGTKTGDSFWYKLLDSLYLTIVTFYTVGFGDILLTGVLGHAVCTVLIVVGVLVSARFFFALEAWARERRARAQNRFLRCVLACLCPVEICSAFACVVVYIGIGTLFIRYFETDTKLNGIGAWIRALYLVVVTVSTVGYGDASFNTVEGRIFAVLWIPGAVYATLRFVNLFGEAALLTYIMPLLNRVLNWLRTLLDGILACSTMAINVVQQRFQRGVPANVEERSLRDRLSAYAAWVRQLFQQTAPNPDEERDSPEERPTDHV